jgi:ABC-type dipeptide/oligopeptide/nickel transport system permease subunit
LSWYDLQRLDIARQPPSQTAPPFDDEAAALVADHPIARYMSGGADTVHGAAGWMGFDHLGRSILFRCLLGGALSLLIGAMAAALAVGLGVTWGATAALAGGHVDMVLMRIVDVLYGLPYILLVILLKVALDTPLTRILDNRHAANIIILFLAIGANSWLTMARVIRGQVLALKAEPFIEAARISGARPARILRRHLLPNLIGPIAVYGSLIVPQAILSESFLSFLGIGVQSPLPTWGSMAADGLHAISTAANHWWLVVFPCALLGITLLMLNALGDALRDAFDPKTA